MRGMASAPDFIQAAPPGRYPSRIIAAAPDFSKEKVKRDGSKGGNESMIAITAEIVDGPYKGQTADDYIGTDGTTKFGVGGKRKLRQLGVDVSRDDDIPDSVIAQQLLGMTLMIEYGNENLQRDVGGGKFEDITEVDSKTNQLVVLKRLNIKGYIRSGAPAQGVAPGAPVGAPQGAPPQGFAPQGFPGAPAPQQGYPQQQYAAPQGAPQGGFPGGAPPGLPQAWGGAPAGAPPAPAGWGAPPNGVPGAAPGMAPANPAWGAGAPPAGVAR